MRPAPRSITLLTMAALALGSVGPGPASARATCTQAVAYDPGITSPKRAIPGYPHRRATTEEINRYLRLVDEESDRVAGGTFATSWRGVELRYALVGEPASVDRADEVASNQGRLRDPRRTTPSEASRIARTEPAIVWYTANVHGDEPSGADAAVEILYELAARTDCQVREMRRSLLVGIIPVQNPDGRDSVARQNAYGFDMNRDWFARTQPETDGKLRLLSRFPPVLYVDAHEQLGSDFFFPPNADPVYHDISPQSIHWINDLYGPALAAKFDERRQSQPLSWRYFNYDIYDLFYMGYGDTVPTTAFSAAGMTFEKGAIDTDRRRWLEQFVAGWTTLVTASAHKQDILNDYYAAHRAALREGGLGRLEPNRVYERGNEVRREVPDVRVRHYFVMAGPRFPDTARLIDRLLRMGVEVHRLRHDLRVPDLRRYGRSPETGVVRAGSFWIPMNQPQKRWIQAMLGEDTYVPFPYFYDVTAWSNPLLMNLDAAFSGARLSPRATRVLSAPQGDVTGDPGRASFFSFPGDTGAAVAAALALDRAALPVRRLTHSASVGGAKLDRGSFVVDAIGEALPTVRQLAAHHHLPVAARRGRPPRGTPVRQPRIALYAPPTATLPALQEESLGHLRYLLDQVWHIPYTPTTGVQVTSGVLTRGRFDVFLVPGVNTFDLAAAGPRIRRWVRAGGVYVGTARPGDTGGTPYAVSAGLTSSRLEGTQGLQVPGSLFRVALRQSSPVTLGASRFGYWFHLGEGVLAPSVTGANPGRYPVKTPDFWFSGYAKGQRALRGSAALVDEQLGQGHVILFSGEPNFRAFTEGSAFLLANALAYPGARNVSGMNLASPAAAGAVRSAMASARVAFGPGRPIRLEVAAEDLASALEVVRRYTGEVRMERSSHSVVLTIPNRAGLDAEWHPFAGRLLPALADAGVEVRSAIV